MSFFLKGDILRGGGAGWDGNQDSLFQVETQREVEAAMEVSGYWDMTWSPRKMKAEREGAPGLKTPNRSILHPLDSLLL